MVFSILVKIGDQVFRAVLDTGATFSIVARRLLKTFKKTKTVAISVGDGRTIHSLGGVDVTIRLGDETVPNTAECWTSTPLTSSLVQTSYEETPR